MPPHLRHTLLFGGILRLTSATRRSGQPSDTRRHGGSGDGPGPRWLMIRVSSNPARRTVPSNSVRGSTRPTPVAPVERNGFGGRWVVVVRCSTFRPLFRAYPTRAPVPRPTRTSRKSRGVTRDESADRGGRPAGPHPSESQTLESGIEMTVAHCCSADLGGEPEMAAFVDESGGEFVGDREAT